MGAVKFKRCNYHGCTAEADAYASRANFDMDKMERRRLCYAHAEEWTRGHQWVSIAYLRPIVVPTPTLWERFFGRRPQPLISKRTRQ